MTEMKGRYTACTSARTSARPEEGRGVDFRISYRLNLTTIVLFSRYHHETHIQGAACTHICRPVDISTSNIPTSVGAEARHTALRWPQNTLQTAPIGTANKYYQKIYEGEIATCSPDVPD